jgi:hypothetical protein
MPITIKKRSAGETPKVNPAPLVENAVHAELNPTAPKNLTKAEEQVVLICTHCGHGYLEPCNGQNDKCMNKRFTDQLKEKEGK